MSKNVIQRPFAKLKGDSYSGGKKPKLGDIHVPMQDVMPTVDLSTSGVSDGDKGDVVVSGIGTVWTVDAGVITNAKLATMAAHTFKGNNTGAIAAPDDLTIVEIQAELSVDDIITLSGVAEGSVALGTFTGTTITDNVDIKAALQELETAVEASSAIVRENVTITTGNAGSNLEVTATAAGTTAAFAGSIYTITLPSGEFLLSASLLIVAADVTAGADGGGVTDWVQVKFDGLPANANLTVPKIPSVQKCALPAAGALTVSNAASVDADNNPAVTVVALGTNSATFRIGGLSVGAQGYLLTFNF